jgi:hypothetical protein
VQDRLSGRGQKGWEDAVGHRIREGHKRPSLRAVSEELTRPRVQLPEKETSVWCAMRECNWLQALEGDIDTSHAGFRHPGALSLEDAPPGAMRPRRAMILARPPQPWQDHVLRDGGVAPPGVDGPKGYLHRLCGVVLPRHVDWQQATEALQKACAVHPELSRSITDGLPVI